MTQRNIVVITAGLSQPSSTRLLADRLAAASELALRELGQEAAVELVELREYAHDLTNHLLTGFPSGGLRGVIDNVVAADGLIVVSPIFSASYSGLFKTFFDVLDADALAGKPVLIAATAGTARHSLALEHALRPMFVYLKAVVVPTSVFAASEEWGRGGDQRRALALRVDRAARELAALVAARPSDVAVDPYADPTPFDQLLN